MRTVFHIALPVRARAWINWPQLSRRQRLQFERLDSDASVSEASPQPDASNAAGLPGCGATCTRHVVQTAKGVARHFETHVAELDRVCVSATDGHSFSFPVIPFFCFASFHCGTVRPLLLVAPSRMRYSVCGLFSLPCGFAFEAVAVQPMVKRGRSLHALRGS